MERTGAKIFRFLILKLCKNKNFRLIAEEVIAARNDVTAKTLLADCFKA